VERVYIFFRVYSKIKIICEFENLNIFEDFGGNCQNEKLIFAKKLSN
jgi:hypothetical protein